MSGLYLDHVLIAVRDLDAVAVTCGDNLGFSVTPEGVHPGRGSHNRLVVFGPEYLEFLSVRDPSQKLFRPNIVPFLESREGLFVFALGTDDVAGRYLEIRQRGVDIGEPVAGSRQAAEGGTAYSWRQAEIAIGETPGSQTFLIQHDQTVSERYTEPAEPTRHANGVAGIHHLTLAVHDAEQAAARWQEVFGLPALHDGDLPDQGMRRVRLDLENSYLYLVSASRPDPLADFLARNGEAPYELGLDVRDLSATVARLRKGKTPTSDSGAAVRVDPDYTHGVPLVLVQSGA